MTSPNDQLRDELSSLAEDAQSEESAERVLTGVSSRLKSSRRTRALSFAGGVVAAGVALVAYGTHQTSAGVEDAHGPALPSMGQSTQSDGLGTVEPGTPCPMAKHAATVAGLHAKVPVWTPAHAVLSDAWTCGQTPVALYGNIQVSYQEGWNDVNVVAKWNDLVSDYGGTVETVLGQPAYVHAATADAPRNNVMVVINGTLISISAKPGVSINALVALGNSLKAPTS